MRTQKGDTENNEMKENTGVGEKRGVKKRLRENRRIEMEIGGWNENRRREENREGKERAGEWKEEKGKRKGC